MDKDIINIFSRRLSQARKMRGLSLEGLSNAMGKVVSRQAINKYEQGKVMPDSKMLLALSAALNVKVDFFFRPFAVSVGEIDFRKKTKYSQAMTKSLKERVQEELERYLEIEQLSGEGTTYSLPKKTVNNIAEARLYATEVRNALQLGMDGISNVVEVLEDNGIKVIEVEEKESFEGFSGYVNGSIPIVVINSKSTSERKRFTAMHELGHLLMVFREGMDHKEPEALCNAFANEMLIPYAIIASKIGIKRHDISMAELIALQKQFGISVDALMYVLHQHNIISDSRYKNYNIKKNINQDFKTEVLKSRFPYEQSGRFFRMVYRVLANELISVSKAAALLNTSVEKVQMQLQLI